MLWFLFFRLLLKRLMPSMVNQLRWENPRDGSERLTSSSCNNDMHSSALSLEDVFLWITKPNHSRARASPHTSTSSARTIPLSKTNLMIKSTKENLRNSVAEISFCLQWNKASYPQHIPPLFKLQEVKSIVAFLTLKYFNSFKLWNALWYFESW